MRLLLRRIAVAACAVVLVGAGLVAVARAYDDGADGLKALWEDILKAARAGDEAKVKEFLGKTVMTEDDFKAVFADEGKAAEVAKKYTEKYAKRWAGDAKGMIAKIKERGFDTVKVVEVTADPKEQTGNDKKVIALLKPGVKMYAVRLVKDNKKTRFDSFFYCNGEWKTGLRLGPLVPADSAATGDDEKKGEDGEGH
jgi:hypothetical protein